MALLYQEIWDTIKAKEEAVITVHKTRAATVIQGVKRTKCVENAHRASVGLIPWSKLVIEQALLSEEIGMIRVHFKLLYSTKV